jgi:hypothetical protein
MTTADISSIAKQLDSISIEEQKKLVVHQKKEKIGMKNS